ncbi:AraC family transcriptional regulator of adaptative response / DNA-3-methyladenine glycosylase II [Hamadaea flava]|uniref:DNA-3-methyladenine glycosylase II n=1 Tax=Hamadaea flava TaxID=1742688 RepID=A0ABV8LJG6_9ACTN|nr:AlkA N-terminal domain-containing protein [Hamadaea flava]MCP2325424.1 AraC family transcriptional regulator of adaptative response / DNA-3-methyladenine glycosylase II [Hamadaea flava]
MDLYRVIAGRDRRFDGDFWFGVTSTGIFCRPSCPARTPKPQNVRFFPSPAAATKAGFRACRRCLPDAVPGSARWDLRADVTARSIRLIADGVVDREGVPGLASRLGYSERQLHRLLTGELGAGPLALARTQRAQTARTLIESTALGLAEIAFAAGFGSVRQFNETMHEVYGCPPSQLRRPTRMLSGEIRLKLAYRPPMDVAGLLRFLGDRAVTGVETYDGTVYRRNLRLPHGRAEVAVQPAEGHVAAMLRLADARDLAPAVARLRRLLDLDADPDAIDTALAADPAFAAQIQAFPGVRVPRAVDGFEAAVRAVVGQQISVAGARTVLAKLCRDGLFPSPAELAELPDEAFAMPVRRRETLRALARAEIDLSLGADRDEARAALLALPGIGPWTADYVLMRALGDPDVLLSTDLGTRHGAAALGLPTAPDELTAYAERWRPWRSYAQLRLWRAAL